MNQLRILRLFITNAYRKEEGVTALEYGIIAALIAAALVTGVTALSTSLSGIFTKIGLDI